MRSFFGVLRSAVLVDLSRILSRFAVFSAVRGIVSFTQLGPRPRPRPQPQPRNRDYENREIFVAVSFAVFVRGHSFYDFYNWTATATATANRDRDCDFLTTALWAMVCIGW